MMRLIQMLSTVVIAMTVPAIAVAQAQKEIVVAEPVHSVGYLPIYVAKHAGMFEKAGLAVKIVTITTPAGHANAVLTGEAFANLGGPEYNGYVKARGGDLKAIVNLIDRGDVYLVAKSGTGAEGVDIAAFVKGKTIAVSYFGATGNSILRLLVNKWGLDVNKDVTLLEVNGYGAVLAAVKTGKAQIGVMREPLLTQGTKEGLWSGVLVNVPKELGPFAYTVISVRGDTIKNDSETVRRFAGALVEGLKFIYANPTEAAAIAKKEFPTMELKDLSATLDRAIADQIWSKDGVISPASWEAAKAAALTAGSLKADITLEDISDMTFVAPAKSQ